MFCVQDSVLCGHHIPAGTDVIYLAWLMSTDEVKISFRTFYGSATWIIQKIILQLHSLTFFIRKPLWICSVGPLACLRNRLTKKWVIHIIFIIPTNNLILLHTYLLSSRSLFPFLSSSPCSRYDWSPIKSTSEASTIIFIAKQLTVWKPILDLDK